MATSVVNSEIDRVFKAHELPGMIPVVHDAETDTFHLMQSAQGLVKNANYIWSPGTLSWIPQTASSGGGGGVTDHGELTGLADDDHTQYLNNTRGDVRYYTKTLLDGGQLDTRYYTETEVDTLISGKENTGVAAGLVTAHEAALDPHPQYLTAAEGAASFAALGHTHVTADITDLGTYTGFDSRYYTETEVNSLLSGYASLSANQTFTGEVSFGDPGTEAGSIVVNGNTYDAIVKINEFDGARDAALILHRHATTVPALLAFARARGTTATHVDVQANDVIGELEFVGWNTSSYYRAAKISVEIDGTPGVSDMPGRVVCSVTADGSATPVEAWRTSSNRVTNFAVTPTVAGNTIWHSGNDGAGSGLDADTLDGLNASAFAAAGHTHVTADITNLSSYTGLDSRYYTETEVDSLLSGKANTSHTHLLANVTDVTMTVANLNSLDDGVDSTLHFHATDRSRANHTGTQTASTISDFSTAADARIAAASINALSDVVVTTPSSGQVLKWNGTNWVNDTDLTGGGGGGSPGGNTGEVQYNNAGAFAGAANVEIDNGNLKLVGVASEPAVPAAGSLLTYAKSIAGRMLPKIIGPAGIDTILQVGLHGNSVVMIAPASGTTAPTIWGGTLTTAATMSLQFTAGSTNRWSATSRKRFQTSTTAGNATGMRTAYTQWFRGNAAGFGGFFFRAQLGAQINLNGGQKFVGLCASTGALAGEPSALVNMCGMGYDAADASTGNWFFMRNDGAGTATKVDLGATEAARGTTQGWDLIMFMAPNGSDLFVRIVNLNTGNTVLDTSYNTDLPAVNTGMAFKAEVRNGAVAAADNLEVAKVYIESDY